MSTTRHMFPYFFGELNSRRTYLLGLGASSLLGFGIYSILANEKLPLSPTRFTHTKLVSSEPCSDKNYKLIELELSEAASLESPPAQIWSVYIKDHDIQIERPFTPLQMLDNPRRLQLWIKRYEHGEVSRWICAQPVGCTIEVRGPVQTLDWALERGKWDHVLMISGGTGITPFLQLLQYIAKDPSPPTECFTLLHSSPTSNQLPPGELMKTLENIEIDPSQKWFNAQLFVDSVESMVPFVLGKTPKVHRIGYSDIQEALAKVMAQKEQRSSSLNNAVRLKTLVLVCGPESLVNAIAGPRKSETDPGPVSGLLGMLGFDSNNVRKL